MSGKYTKKSEEVLKCAKTHAMEKGSKSVGSEHILLGILEVPDTLAYNMLHDRGITVEKVLNSVNFTVSDDSEVAVSDREGYTPRAKRILENASSLAKKFDSRNRAYSYGYNHRERLCGFKNSSRTWFR